MILVIDGYNLLNEMYRHKLVSESQLRSFLQKIDAYACDKGHQVIIAFDGYKKFDIYNNEYQDLSLIYTKNISADDYIKDYLHRHKSEDIAVVSSDLEIYRAAVSLGIVTIKSSAFIFLVHECLKNPINIGSNKNASLIKLKGQTYKLSEEDNPELDQLMGEAEDIPYYKLEDYSQPSIASASKKKLSKSEKKLLNIRKKL